MAGVLKSVLVILILHAMPTLKIRKYKRSVYVIYTHRMKIFKISTGVKVDDKDWNGSFPRKSCPDYEIIMRQITDMELRVLNASLKLRAMGIDPVVDMVRAEFYAQVTTVKPFWELYDEYLEVQTFKPGTRQKAIVYRNALERFCTQSGYSFNIDTWDNLTFGRFIQHLLINQKYADSTINRLVRGTKSFLRFEPSWIMPEQVLEFNQLKTGGKAMPPLYEATRQVLSKWNGIPPKISNAKFNKHLKVFFQVLNLDRPIVTNVVKGKVVHRSVSPLYSVITSHDARRTFITLCLQKGMPIQDVIRMSGHSDYKGMKPYMRVSLKHLRSEADKWDI